MPKLSDTQVKECELKFGKLAEIQAGYKEYDHQLQTPGQRVNFWLIQGKGPRRQGRRPHGPLRRDRVGLRLKISFVRTAAVARFQAMTLARHGSRTIHRLAALSILLPAAALLACHERAPTVARQGDSDPDRASEGERRGGAEHDDPHAARALFLAARLPPGAAEISVEQY
jgi:hypothetical protein